MANKLNLNLNIMKHKNGIFNGNQFFVIAEILVFHQCLYKKYIKYTENKVQSISVPLLQQHTH